MDQRRPVMFIAVRLSALFALAALLATQVPVLVDLSVRGVVYENQGITDLGRDLLGAAVIEQGGVPYQQIGDLLTEYDAPDLPLSGAPRVSGWVVHPPLALAGARSLLTISGSEAERVGRRLGALSTLGLAVAIGAILWRRNVVWAVAVGMATLVWAPTYTDTIWIQGNAIAGFGLLLVVLLDARQRRTTARVVLGLLVAWKPWLAVFALALPQSTSVWKDVLWVGGTAVAVTLVSLPWVGGFEALRAWVTDALPGNSVEARDTPSNLSWISMSGPGLATGVYLAAAMVTPLVRRRIPRDLWLLLPVGLATALAPFVWDHYWLALAPVVWIAVSEARLDLRIPAFAWMGFAVLPVALSRLGQPGMEHRVFPMVLAAAMLLLGTLAVAGGFGPGKHGRRNGGDDPVPG